jgi:hypothetical protein
MKKIYTLMAAVLMTTATFAQGKLNIVIFSEDGEPFFAYVNGVRQNNSAETNIRITDLTSESFHFRIVFANSGNEPITKNQYLPFGSEYTFKIKKGKSGYKLAPFGEVALAESTSTAPSYAYSATENNNQNTGTQTNTDSQVSSNTNTNTGNGNANVTVNTNTGTTGTHVQTSETISTTTTTTSNGNQNNTTGENVGLNMNVGANGLSINMNVNGTGTTNGTQSNTSVGINGVENGNVTTHAGTTGTTTGSTTVTTTTTTYSSTTTTSGTTGTENQNTNTNTNYDNNNYNTTNTNNSNNSSTVCYYPASDADFTKMKTSIESKTYQDVMMSTAKQATKNNCLSVAQIGEIMKVFMMDDSKLEYAKYAYDYCTEKNNYYQLADVLTYSSTQEEFNAWLEKK